MITTSSLTCDTEKSIFIGEMSDVSRHLKQIFDDACDIGFELLSTRTGKVSKWYESQHEYQDGELVSTIFRPTAETVRRLPQLKQWSVLLFND